VRRKAAGDVFAPAALIAMVLPTSIFEEIQDDPAAFVGWSRAKAEFPT
jgi:hypothetical protein